MARIELLAVGRELLIGRTLDTNATWVGRRVARMGGMIKLIATVDDDLSEISAALRASLSRRPDVIVTMGGLGPTPDDMTLKGVARGLRTGLRVSGSALRLIREHYAEQGVVNVEITPARRKMATMPAGSRPLRNGVGTAPGVMITRGGTAIFCLPGVPAEMKAIFRASVEPELRKRIGRLHRRALRFKIEGVRESELAPVIGSQLKKHPETYIKSHPRGTAGGISRIELDVVAVSEERAEARAVGDQVAAEMLRAVREMGGRVVRASGPVSEGT